MSNLLWELFKKTGNIDTFMEYKQIENLFKHEKKFT